MTAPWRVLWLVAIVGALVAPVQSRAQETGANTVAPAPDAVGPSGLENFNLPGEVTTPAKPATPAPQTAPRPRPNPPAATSNVPATTAPQSASKPATSQAESKAVTPAPTQKQTVSKPAPVESVGSALPPLGDALSGPTLPSVPPPAKDDQVPWPWLVLSALVVLGAGAYAFVQRRKAALVDGGDETLTNAFVPNVPECETASPAPAPVPAPPQPPATPTTREPADLGFVNVTSRRMRPWLEIAFRPVAASLDEENFVLEFELGLFNSGIRDARAILVEASFFNADREQDVAIEKFYDNPAGVGERVISLGASKRMAISNKIVTPRANLRLFESEGRKFFVPIIAFNALYRWGEVEGQTSASYIVGRRTEGDKMAPLRIDLGVRTYGGLGRKPLPTARRT